VLQATSEEENSQIEAALKNDPELQKELNIMQKGLEQYVGAYSAETPVQGKERFLCAINFDTDNQETSEKTFSHSESSAAISRSIIPWRSFSVAASILLLLSIAANFLLYNQNQEAADQIAELRKAQSLIASKYERLEAKYDGVEEQIANLTNAKKIYLKGTERFPGSNALVYWNAKNNEVLLDKGALPPPPSGMQYQLWAMKDGTPIDLGVYDWNEPMQSMNPTQAADAFAITLEKEGGVPSPTLERLYVIGHV
jgi:anti-sigma-K factor RskA